MGQRQVAVGDDDVGRRPAWPARPTPSATAPLRPWPAARAPGAGPLGPRRRPRRRRTRRGPAAVRRRRRPARPCAGPARPAPSAESTPASRRLAAPKALTGTRTAARTRASVRVGNRSPRARPVGCRDVPRPARADSSGAAGRTPAGVTVGVLGGSWRVGSRRGARSCPPTARPTLDWWVAAEDRWHTPAIEPTVRQRAVEGVPVVETVGPGPRGRRRADRLRGGGRRRLHGGRAREPLAGRGRRCAQPAGSGHVAAARDRARRGRGRCRPTRWSCPSATTRRPASRWPTTAAGARRRAAAADLPPPGAVVRGWIAQAGQGVDLRLPDVAPAGRADRAAVRPAARGPAPAGRRRGPPRRRGRARSTRRGGRTVAGRRGGRGRGRRPAGRAAPRGSRWADDAGLVAGPGGARAGRPPGGARPTSSRCAGGCRPPSRRRWTRPRGRWAWPGPSAGSSWPTPAPRRSTCFPAPFPPIVGRSAGRGLRRPGRRRSVRHRRRGGALARRATGRCSGRWPARRRGAHELRAGSGVVGRRRAGRGAPQGSSSATVTMPNGPSGSTPANGATARPRRSTTSPWRPAIVNVVAVGRGL